MGYILVATTVIFTVYGQLVIKWKLGSQVMPEGLAQKILFLFNQLLDPWVFSGFAAAFIAALAWMAAMTKLPLNKAYPFTSLAIVLVLVGSSIALGERISRSVVVGAVLIVLGLITICQDL